MINISDIYAAQKRIKSKISKTPCVLSNTLSNRFDCEVYLKLDLFQKTGSFKERGALNKLLLLSDEDKKAGIVSASSGNHAQAVAYHAGLLGIKATIFMPVNVPFIKEKKTRSYGADVRIVGESYDDAYDLAKEYASKEDRVFVHAYNDFDIIAGQGTLGLEILEKLPNLDGMIVPVGGGGLISGIGLCLKSLNPDIQLFGVEARELDSVAKAIKYQRVTEVRNKHTLADGIAARFAGQKTFELCNKFVDYFDVVNNDEISKALLYLIEEEKLAAEGAGAVGIAALMSLKYTEKIKSQKLKQICILISGGNIDANLMGKIIERGLVNSGRLMRTRTEIEDRPGALMRVLSILKECGANVLKVKHERVFEMSCWDKVFVSLVLETKSHEHVEEIQTRLKLEMKH